MTAVRDVEEYIRAHPGACICEIFDVVGKYGELADHAVEYRSNVESGYWSPYKGLETVMRRHKVSESIARDIPGLS